MYFEITTRCNMSCAHCCIDAKRRGIDMSPTTFLHAMELLGWKDEGYITIGGGEPTMHPHFQMFVTRIVEHTEWMFGIVTNGTNIRKQRWLMRNHDEWCTDTGLKRMHLSLSWDIWHNRKMVTQEVFDWYRRHADLRDVGKHMDGVVAVGRAKKTKQFGSITYGNGLRRCVCDELIIRANGDVYPCGCDDIPKLGNVDDPDSLKWMKYMDLGYKRDCWHWNNVDDNWEEHRRRHIYQIYM